MSDLSGAGARNRSLTTNQTLEELLGITKKDDRISLGSPARPPTRHGRDSVSSTEENKDPSPKSSSNGIESWRMEENLTKSYKEDDADDDFLQKLNEMRRRSLIMSHEANESNILEPTPEIRIREIPRKPSQIREESEDDTNNNSKGRDVLKADKMALTVSRPSTGTSTKTIRIEDESVKDVPKRAKSTESKKSKPSTALRSQAPSTGSSAHQSWLRKKTEEEKERKENEKKKAEEKKQMEEEKRKTAAKLFERWKAERDERLREEKRVQREKEREKRKQEEEMKAAKRRDAEKTFVAWKMERSKSLSVSQKSLKQREEERREKERKEKETKQKEAETAFDAWVASKLDAKQKAKEALEKKRLEEKERQEAEKEYKEMLAQQAYETWLEIKESERDIAERVGSAMSRDSSRHLPWVPPSNTIPRQFVSSGKNRRRSLDRRSRTVSAQIHRVPRAVSVKSIYSLK